MPLFPIVIICPVLTASLTSFSTTQAMPTQHPVRQSRRGGRVEWYSWCWGPRHPQNACVKPTALLQSSLAWSCGHSGTGVWRTSGAFLACLFPFGFIWKQPSLLRLRQLCDRNQGVVIMWPFKCTFLTQTKTWGGGGIHIWPLPTSWLDSQEHRANTMLFLFRTGRSVHGESVTGVRVKPGLFDHKLSSVCSSAAPTGWLTPSVLCTSSSCITVPAKCLLSTKFLVGLIPKPFKTRHSFLFPDL